jgi:hypothetical protein
VLKAGLGYSDKMDTNDYIFYDFQARDIYEEAIETVLTVRDFTQVFDAYAEFEKNVMSAKIQTMEETGASEEGIHIYYHIQSHVILPFFSEKKCINNTFIIRKYVKIHHLFLNQNRWHVLEHYFVVRTQ